MLDLVEFPPDVPHGVSESVVWEDTESHAQNLSIRTHAPLNLGAQNVS